MGEIRRAMASGAVFGLILALALIGVIFATGQTFGQRCAKDHQRDSDQWRACVDRLTAGAKP